MAREPGEPEAHGPFCRGLRLWLERLVLHVEDRQDLGTFEFLSVTQIQGINI